MARSGRKRAPRPWSLLDAEVHNEAHPRSFFIPSRDERETLEVGELVKLVFEDEDGDGERMWVEVTDRAPGGYVGILTNQPIVIDLERGARIEFEPRHVIDIHEEVDDPYEALVLYASARLLDRDDNEVGYAVFDTDDVGREVADDRSISGWQAMVGDETEEELDDVEAVRLPSLSWFMQREPAFAWLVQQHDGTDGAWARRPDLDTDEAPGWEPVED
jgi:hypothetical protein